MDIKLLENKNDKLIAYKFDDIKDYQGLMLLIEDIKEFVKNSDIEKDFMKLCDTFSNDYNEKDNTILFTIQETCSLLYILNIYCAGKLIMYEDLKKNNQYLNYCDIYNSRIIEFYKDILNSTGINISEMNIPYFNQNI